MARHRNIRNLNLEDERDDDYSYSYGRSVEEDNVPMSPSTAQFIYQRHRLTSSSAAGRVSEFIPEEDYSNDSDDMQASGGAGRIADRHQPLFDIDDVVAVPTSSRENPFFPPRTESPFTPTVSTANNARVSNRTPRGADSNAGSSSKVEAAAQATNLPLEQLKIAEKTPSRNSSTSPSRAGKQPIILTPNSSSHRLSQLAHSSTSPSFPSRVLRRPIGTKPMINLVVVGHVDAGKSTMMGHLLYLVGAVDQRMIHKYKQESQRSGKASFAFAWVLDETEEERERGVTMDIAKTTFDTDSKHVVLLDAPGHKDFIPNMITGAAQADAGLLVVNATRGEFETGFDQGGQTREHAMLLRSLGVAQLAVAVNKLDTIEWSQTRYDEICETLKSFLQKQAGFIGINFVPVSGLNGDNLTKKPDASHPLARWYNGPTLLEVIDNFSSPERPEDKPLRVVVTDVFKGMSAGISLCGKVESGAIQAGDKVFVLPNNKDLAHVKSVQPDENAVDGVCFAGDQCLITLTGPMEPNSIGVGHVICHVDNQLVAASKYRVKLVLLNVLIPITQSSRFELHAHSLCEPCVVTKLLSCINKTTGEVLKKRPRCLTKNMTGVVDIETERPICLESYSVCKPLGRISLRANGKTIAAGLVEKAL